MVVVLQSRFQLAGCQSLSLRTGRLFQAMGLTMVGWTLMFSGCAAPLRHAQVDAETAKLFAPTSAPADFDRERAFLPLSSVPDGPTFPSTQPFTSPVELPRQALNRMKEARRLFAGQRYSEAITELSTALRYNADIHEAHQLLAIACLLSGDGKKAGQHAQKAIEIKADSLPSWYVLARLAQAGGRADLAMRHYRLALQCEPGPGEAAYRILTHYQLGPLLMMTGYYAAAAEQIEAFEKGFDMADQETLAQPELAALTVVQRSALIVRGARVNSLLGEYGRAADALGRAVALTPQDWKIRNEHVRALVRANRLNEAATAAGRFVADSRGKREALVLLPAVYRFIGHPEQAVPAIKAILGQQSDNVDLRLCYVDLLIATDRRDEASVELDELLTRHPELPDVQWKLIRLNAARGDWPGWLNALARELTARPDGIRRLTDETDSLPMGVAKAMVAEGLRPAGQGAMPKYLPVLAVNDPRNAAIDFLLGQLADRLKQPEDARQYLERSAARPGTFLPTTIILAETHLGHCQWEDARRIIENAIKSMTQPSAVFEFMLGQSHDGLDHHKQAIACYEKAIQIDRADTRPIFRMAQLYERIGKYAEAIKQYDQILTLNPDNLEARERIVRVLLPVRDQQQRLVDELEAMRRLDPDGPATQRCLAMTRFLRLPIPDWPNYLKVMMKVVEGWPEELQSREDLVRAYIGVRDLESARREVEVILKRDPYSASGNELLSHILSRMLAFDEVVAHLARLTTWYPNREPWLRGLARMQLLQLNYDAAIVLWNRILALPSAENQKTLYRSMLIETYRRAGRFNDARREAKAWLDQISPKDAEYRQYRWFVLAVEAGAKDHDRYLAFVREWLAADMQNADLKSWLLGVEGDESADVLAPPTGDAGLVGAGRFDEAMTQALAWLNENPGEGERVGSVMMVLHAAGRHSEAIELALNQSASRSQPQARVNQLNVLRTAYLKADRSQEAAAVTKELLSELRKLFDTADDQRKAVIENMLLDQRRLYSRILARAKQYEQAINNLQDMITEMDELRRKAAAILPRIQDPRQQASLWLSSREATRQQVLMYQSLAYVYQAQGDIDLAIQTFREAYKLLPDDMGLNNDFGYTLADHGRDLDEAEKLIRFAVSENPEEAAYMDSLGWLYYHKGDFKKARTWLVRSASMEEGQDAVIFDHLGDTCWRLGDKDQAVRNWQRSMEIYEQKRRKGDAEPDDKSAVKTRDKLATVAKGQPPEVAEVVPASRTAP